MMKILTHPIHFHTAMLERTPVDVWILDEYQDTGIIEQQTEDAVYINGGRYLKAVCQFIPVK